MKVQRDNWRRNGTTESEEMRAIKEEIVFWDKLGKLLGWELYGWNRYLTASFRTPGNWDQQEVVQISGAAARAILNKAKHQHRSAILRSRKR